MRVLGLHGSARQQGNTQILLDKVLEGVTSTTIYLQQKTILPIDDRRHDPNGFPIVNDDYDEIIHQVLGHDVLVLATPIYWYGMSGQMKDFLDRWSHTLRDPRYQFKNDMAGKQAYVLVVGGDAPRIKGLPLIQQFDYIFDFMKMDFKGYIIAEANKPGDVLSDSRALEEAAWLNEQLRK